jgi:hypothetical protein
MATARTQSSTPPRAKPRSDVYVGLLILALLAQVAGAAFLYLDYSQYPESKPPQVRALPAKAGPPAGGPAVPPAGVGGGQPPAGMAGGMAGGGPPPGGMAGMAGGGGPPPGGMAGGRPPGAMMGQPPGAMMGGKAPMP